MKCTIQIVAVAAIAKKKNTPLQNRAEADTSFVPSKKSPLLLPAAIGCLLSPFYHNLYAQLRLVPAVFPTAHHFPRTSSTFFTSIACCIADLLVNTLACHHQCQ